MRSADECVNRIKILGLIQMFYDFIATGYRLQEMPHSRSRQLFSRCWTTSNAVA